MFCLDRVRRHDRPGYRCVVTLANLGLLVGVSLFTRQSAIEQVQAVVFTEVYRSSGGDASFWSGTTTEDELRALAARFLGEPQARAAFDRYLETNPGMAAFRCRVIILLREVPPVSMRFRLSMLLSNSRILLAII